MSGTEAGKDGGVLIVIPCLNEEAHLPGLLHSLIEDAPLARIVVADGGSRDGSREIVAARASTHSGLVLLHNPRKLQSAGVNAAVRAFGDGCRWLVRVDAHCGYPRGYVAGLVEAAGRTGADAVVVPMRTVGHGGFQRAVAAVQNSRLGTGGSPHRHVGGGRFVDHGHHALCRLDLFRQVDGYDESFSHNEDAELDHRLGLAGGRIWLEPSLAVDYSPRSRPIPLFRQYLAYGKGRAMTVRKHRMRMKLRQLAPLAIAPAVLAGVAAPVAPLLVLPALGWALACIGGGAALAVRRRDPAAVASGPAAMLMHLGWSLGFWTQWMWSAVSRPGGDPKT